MGTRSRVLAVILLGGMAGVSLPSFGTADTDDGSDFDWDAVAAIAPADWSNELKEQILQAVAQKLRQGEEKATTRGEGEKRDGVDWDTARSTPPEEWSEELKTQIVAAGYDLRAIAQRVRQGQEKTATRDERKTREGVDWETVKTAPPEEWSEELKGQVLRAVAQRVRQGQEKVATRERDGGSDRLSEFRRVVVETAMGTPPEDWSHELKDKIIRAGWNVDELAEGIRERQHAQQEATSDLDAIGQRIEAAVERGDMTPEEGRARMEAARQSRQSGSDGDSDRLREFQRAVVETAMAAAPEDWSDELKARIVRAGWDLREFARGIRERQRLASESNDPSSDLAESQTGTAVEEYSWGQVKAEVANPE